MGPNYQIWNLDSGIADLDGDAGTLASSEIPGIKAVWQSQRSRLAGTKQLEEFTERLSREWAIETGIIENLYDIERGVTQTLIERGFQAEFLSYGSTNRPRDFVIQILQDQKEVLEGVFDFVKDRRPLSTSYIKELHAALLRSQDTTDALDPKGKLVEVPLLKGDWKKHSNFPTREGTQYNYCPPEHVASEMDRLLEMHQEHVGTSVPAEVEAAWLHHRFTQIHPFQDGNGRVARTIASLVLIKAGLFPLVVTRDDKPDYLEALEAADQGNLKPLVALFVKLQRAQFTKATAISEIILSAGASVQQLLAGLAEVAAKVAGQKQFLLSAVFDRARELEEDVFARLQEIVPSILEALRKMSNDPNVFVSKSSEPTGHYFRAQIIYNARKHLHYFADTADFRSWVALNMKWERKAKLVFAFHGMGRPFTGTLICAPFLELRDTDDDEQTRSTIIPVSSEGFPFFYSETTNQVGERFRAWREDALRVALRELSDNL